jgi:YVTN family beta-propeller protein
VKTHTGSSGDGRHGPGRRKGRLAARGAAALLLALGTGVGAAVPTQAAAPAVPSGVFVYTGLMNTPQVVVTDPVTGTVVANIPTNDWSEGLAASADGTRVYGVGQTGVVSVIDTATRTMIATIPIPFRNLNHFYRLALNPSGTRLYVTYVNNGVMSPGGPSIAVIDTATGRVVSSILMTTDSAGLAVSPDGSRLFVTDPGDDSLSVVDLALGRLTSVIPVGLNEPLAVVLNPAGTTAYVSGDHGVAVVDTATGALTATITQPTVTPVQLALNPKGTRLYVAGGSGGDVQIVNLRKNTLAPSIPVTDSRGIGLDPSGRHAYFDYFQGLLIADTRTRTVTATILFPGSPSTLAVVVQGGHRKHGG